MSAQLKEQLEELAPPMLYHMTHIDNLDSILTHGLYAHNNPLQQQDISNRAVNSRRGYADPIYHKSIHDYVPFYFNPRNAMLYRTQSQYKDNIVILGFDSRLLLMENMLFTNGNAAANGTQFFNDLQALKTFNWNLIFSRSWNGYGEHVKKLMMSEVLINQHLRQDMIESINCSSTRMKKAIKNNFSLNTINVTADTNLFFENLQ